MMFGHSLRALLNLRPRLVLAVVRRELLELRRNRILLVAVLLPPAVLVSLPVLMTRFGDAEPLPAQLVAGILASRPEWAALTADQLASAFALSQMLLYFLLLPATIPLAIAAYSIVGEKQTRSLEAVIASPIRTDELLAGKVVGAILPSIAAVWAAYGALLALIAVLFGPALAVVVVDPAWLAAVFVLGPAVSLVSVVGGVMVSSRVNDPRAAQQLGTVLILPIVAVGVLEASSGTVYGAAEYLRAAAVVAVVGLAGLRLSARLFGRETILLRWR